MVINTCVRRMRSRPPGGSDAPAPPAHYSTELQQIKDLPVNVWDIAHISELIMSAEHLAKIPEADIDPNGVFKYVLIRVHSKTDESYVDIVRGYTWAEYHADIYDKVSGELERAGGVDCECIGGGRIRHDSADKKIHVYGYSMGFGRANHAVSTEKLTTRYPDYEITWANDGY